MIEFTEQRVVNRLCSYWNLLRGDRNYPARDEIEPEEVREIWPHCFIIEVHEEDEVQKYNCVYLGDEAAEIYHIGVTLAINNTEAFSTFVVDNLYPYLDETIMGKEPIVDEIEVQDHVGNDLRLRQCLLPLSENGKKIDYIIGAVGCRRMQLFP